MGLRVKQLEWEKEPDGRWVFSEAWKARPFDGFGYLIALSGCQWSWVTTWDESWNHEPDGYGESLKECQRQCQAHWESDKGIGQCLEFVACSMDPDECLTTYEDAKAENDALWASMQARRCGGAQ